ncbi:hypothetical protein TcasGA2_TC012329 [Tribolium castaneum]|uniref:Uncharacterized protein n=1 Tax=Tribolium castaneum TaxID=7070 RepID=D6X1Q1_TRICA|nr:hypothetical protein TcasGA2_TC012329 [Tribolium castaneum]
MATISDIAQAGAYFIYRLLFHPPNSLHINKNQPSQVLHRFIRHLSAHKKDTGKTINRQTNHASTKTKK